MNEMPELPIINKSPDKKKLDPLDELIGNSNQNVNSV